ncbi:aldo-keto reductase family 1 member B1-like [Macrosteles quadrilineatus]|uniref:aldo-keto reductase family 1 member B1-like n=1 Tax=Macrosteles quadrilineatus TaxID=74068 RepID=UPI0023E12074|nr:aldo-keto reductase family 1 member B1-like [Macrosteles quadrilineatus]
MVVPALPLNNGLNIPLVGLGTWQAPDAEVSAAVKYAIDVGYRHIDTAHLYGNEKSIGAAVRDKVEEGVVSRSDMFITTKLWNTYHSVEDVVPTCRQSLERLGLDYIDLYLVHWPFGLKSKHPPQIPQPFEAFDTTSIEDTWREMERCVELGLVKSIGVSNFNQTQVQRVLDTATIKPVVNQVECHMLLNQKPLIEFCKSVDIVVEGYAPFGSPTRPNAPPDAANVFHDPRVLKVAATHSKTSGQVILRYLVQLGIVVLPKSVTPARIKANLDLFNFELSSQEMETLSSLDCHLRMFSYLPAKTHPDYPFKEDSSAACTSATFDPLS